MSTAVAEAPKTEPEVKAPPTEREVLVQSFLKPKVATPGSVVTPPQVVVPPVTEEKKPDEKKPEEKVHKSPEESFAELRKKFEDADKAHLAEKAERERILAEYEAFKKQPIPKEFEEKLTKAQQEAQRLDNELRAAALEQSPGFKKEYEDAINISAKVMMDVMIANGVDPKEARRSIEDWDKRFFGEKVSEMDAVSRMDFESAYMEANRIDQRRRQALANAEQEWKQREVAMGEQQKVQMAQHEAYLKSEESAMLKELFSTEGLKENTELQAKAKEAVAASYQFTPRELMHRVATATLLASAVQQKDAAIQELQAKYDELKKKADADEAFIKDQRGGIPRINPTDAAMAPEDRAKIAQQFLKPVIKVPGT